MTEKGNRVLPKDYQGVVLWQEGKKRGKNLYYLHIKNFYVNASL